MTLVYQAQLIDHLIGQLNAIVCARRILHFHRVSSTFHLDNGRPIKISREALNIDGRGGDDDLQVRPFGQQPAQIPQQEIDIEAAFVGLVDDQGIVSF